MVTAGVAFASPEARALEAFAALLALIAAVYVGAASARDQGIVLQTVLAVM